MKIVEKVELEKWCSGDCGKRALYLRVQLNDTPAWERAGDLEGRSTLKILKDSVPLEADDRRADVGRLAQQLQQLAVERGVVNENVLSSLLKATVIESHQTPQPPRHISAIGGERNQDHGSIEGYTSRLNGGHLQPASAEGDGNDVMNTI